MPAPPRVAQFESAAPSTWAAQVPSFIVLSPPTSPHHTRAAKSVLSIAGHSQAQPKVSLWSQPLRPLTHAQSDAAHPTAGLLGLGALLLFPWLIMHRLRRQRAQDYGRVRLINWGGPPAMPQRMPLTWPQRMRLTLDRMQSRWDLSEHAMLGASCALRRYDSALDPTMAGATLATSPLPHPVCMLAMSGDHSAGSRFPCTPQSRQCNRSLQQKQRHAPPTWLLAPQGVAAARLPPVHKGIAVEGLQAPGLKPIRD